VPEWISGYMGILQRYILWELLKVFALSLGALTLLLLFVGLAQQVIKEGLTLWAVLQVIPYLLPNALRFAVPGTLLFAVCSVYGRISSANELTAIRAAGVSTMTVVAPGLMVALVFSLFSVWLNDIAVSWGHQGVRRVVIQSADDIVYSVLRTKKSFSSDRFSILVRDVKGQTLIRPEIAITNETSRGAVTISASAAELRSDVEGEQLIVELTNSRIVSTGEKTQVFEYPGTYITSIPLVDPTAMEGIRDASHQPMRRIPLWRGKMRDYHRQISQMLAAKGAVYLVSGQSATVDDPFWEYWIEEKNWSAAQINRLKTEPHRRWANGFSCLSFVVLGIPLAIWRRSNDYVTSFFAAFLPVLLVYYPLMALGVDRAKDGAWPACFVWLGYVVVLGIGGWLLYRVAR